jgi:hypothetical protein
MKKLMVTLGISALMIGTVLFADSENSAYVYNHSDEGKNCHTVPQIGYAGELSTTSEIQLVRTKNGNAKITCHFDIPEGQEPIEMFESEGWMCGFHADGLLVWTTHSKFVADPDGRAMVSCHYKEEAVD